MASTSTTSDGPVVTIVLRARSDGRYPVTISSEDGRQLAAGSVTDIRSVLQWASGVARDYMETPLDLPESMLGQEDQA